MAASRNTRVYRFTDTTGVIPSLDSLANHTSATNAIKVTITKIWHIIAARVNGARPVGAETAPISSKPNKPWHAVKSPLRPLSVYCVTKHFSGTNATTTTCSDVASASNPRATLIKSSQTEVTSTNQTQGRAVAEIASLNTSWVGKMPHLRKDSLSGNSPMFYSTSARRCGRSQKETCVTQ